MQPTTKLVAFINTAHLVGVLHERTGSLSAPTLVLAACSLVTLGCALFFPDRPEELQPELWRQDVAAAE